MYTLLEKGHTISATDFDLNFKHIGQGNLEPKGGVLLENTTGVYDLGSDLFRFNNIHIQNVHLSDGGEIQKCMNLISEVTLTATASSIEFTGLNEDTDEIYEIIVNGIGYNTNSAYFAYFNGDSGSNYGYQQLTMIDAMLYINRGIFPGIYLGATGFETSAALNFKFFGVFFEKYLLTKSVGNTGESFLREENLFGQNWNNASTLTSMKFVGSFDVGTNIQIWAKR
jgi:hypothetical protein